MFSLSDYWHAWSYVLLAFYPVALLCMGRAILRSRTPQGATAWAVALLSFPIITVPLYLIFGRAKFNGYRVRRQALDREARAQLAQIEEIRTQQEVPAPPELADLVASTAPAKQIGFTGQNRIALLVDADVAYPAMLEALEKARDYILFQFYIFRSDEAGARFAEVLMRKAREGVEIRFLYDEIGSKISRRLVKDMMLSGIQVGKFNSTKGPRNHFQVNFRNHRKLIIVDGRVAFTGGMNIGDEYLSMHPVLGHWRDTQIRVEGPAVMAIQVAFAKDWYWSQGELIRGRWKSQAVEGGTAPVFAFHTGPVDDFRGCLLSHVSLINAAKKRLWIATPYLVLPDSLNDALALAALRGVDVRLIVPSKSDNLLVKLASHVYERELMEMGIKVFRYDGGFLHQKAAIVDDVVAVVGSANLDFRSMFLNFELTVMSTDKPFIADVDAMFKKDFQVSSELILKNLRLSGYWLRLLERGADLFAPIL